MAVQYPGAEDDCDDCPYQMATGGIVDNASRLICVYTNGCVLEEVDG